MGGTITLNGKTYNLSLISAVYTERILQANSGEIMQGLFASVVIVIISLFLLLIGNYFWGLFGLVLWGGMLLLGLSQLGSTNTTNEYSLIFEIGGKKEVVFSGNVVEVENIKNDITVGIEKGYFPNYLQGR